MSRYSISKSISNWKQSTLIVYFSQNSNSLLCLPLCSKMQEESLDYRLAAGLFFELRLSMLSNNQSFYSKVDININLHVRIENEINGIPIYDSELFSIPENNPVLAIGKTEKSLLSYCLFAEYLYKKRNDKSNFDPTYMYRKYLHLGDKPVLSGDFLKDKSSIVSNLYDLHFSVFNQESPNINSTI